MATTFPSHLQESPYAPENWEMGLIQPTRFIPQIFQPPVRPESGKRGLKEYARESVIEASKNLSGPLRAKIKELAELDANWDGDGAEAVKLHVLADIVQTLDYLRALSMEWKEPFLAPSFTGYIQIEWHDDKRCLEIDATKDGWTVVGTEEGPDGKPKYSTAECGHNDLAKLREFYNWFMLDSSVWPSP